MRGKERLKRDEKIGIEKLGKEKESILVKEGSKKPYSKLRIGKILLYSIILNSLMQNLAFPIHPLFFSALYLQIIFPEQR